VREAAAEPHAKGLPSALAKKDAGASSASLASASLVFDSNGTRYRFARRDSKPQRYTLEKSMKRQNVTRLLVLGMAFAIITSAAGSKAFASRPHTRIGGCYNGYAYVITPTNPTVGVGTPVTFTAHLTSYIGISPNCMPQWNNPSPTKYTASGGSMDGNTFTASAPGKYTIYATYSGPLDAAPNPTEAIVTVN
jgi:hypothetical protein